MNQTTRMYLRQICTELKQGVDELPEQVRVPVLELQMQRSALDEFEDAQIVPLLMNMGIENMRNMRMINFGHAVSAADKHSASPGVVSLWQGA